MTPDEQLISLRAVAPFDRISDDGLAILLELADVRRYGSDAIVPASASPRLIIVIAGGVRNSTRAPAGPVIGLADMFVDAPLSLFVADPGEGAVLVSIDRQTFFTIARASPELVRGFLELGPSGTQAA